MRDEETATPPAPAKSGLDRLLLFLNRVESAIAILAFSLMLIDVLAGVVMRYLLQIPFPWGEEAARYLMVLGILAGIGIGVKEGAHLNVELFRSWLPKLPKTLVTAIADLLTLAAYIFLVVVSYKFIQMNKAFGQLTAALNIPIYYIYYILIVGFIIAAFEHAVVMYKKIVLHQEKPFESEEEVEGFGI